MRESIKLYKLVLIFLYPFCPSKDDEQCCAPPSFKV